MSCKLSPVRAAALQALSPPPALAALLTPCATPVLRFSRVSALFQTSAITFPAGVGEG